MKWYKGGGKTVVQDAKVVERHLKKCERGGEILELPEGAKREKNEGSTYYVRAAKRAAKAQRSAAEATRKAHAPIVPARGGGLRRVYTWSTHPQNASGGGPSEPIWKVQDALRGTEVAQLCGCRYAVAALSAGGDVWAWTEATGDIPAGVIAIAGADATAEATGEAWWIVGGDGLYRTDDGGATLRRVLE